tara:strand:+ start:116 stop:349 length:234 start_codon:yes stop_codon:yes gene_type:complete
MKYVYIVYRTIGAYKYVQSIFTSLEKANNNLVEIRLDVAEGTDMYTETKGNTNIDSLRWTSEHGKEECAWIQKYDVR